MTWSIKDRKHFSDLDKLRFSRQSRDNVCPPVAPRTEIMVREDNPGPYLGLIGQRLRVGYYRRSAGLNVIWIVYPNAEYGETIAHTHLREFFNITLDSDETDLYGMNRPELTPL